MKKLMFSLAVAGLCGAVFANVESKNVVGYAQKDGFPCNAFRLAAIQFEGLKVDSANLNDLVPYTSEVSIDDDFETLAPHIQVQLTTGGYDMYYYVKDAWYAYDEGSDTDYFKPGWCDINGVLATPELLESEDAVSDGEVTAGAAVWFKDQTALASSTVALNTNGQLIPEDVDIDVPQAFRLRAGAFPIEFNLNDSTKVVFSGMPDAFANSDNPDYETKAAHIQVQLPSGGYDMYYYVKDAWYAYDEGSDTDYFKPGWCDINGVLATPELFETEDAVSDGNVKVGQAFWARATSADKFSIKYLNPLAK